MQAGFNEVCRERGAPALPEGELIHTSPWLNLYLYPEAVDYPRARPLEPEWRNLEASVRATDEPWEPPGALAEDGGEGALVYLSLGSLGSADVELMQRLVDALAQTPHRVIVSKGPQHELLRLADNMVGEEFLPQTSILPTVDVVITHGGNNTVTECLYFGKPMVVLPLFWDQYDNAQRMHELGLGRRLATYEHEPEQLARAIDDLRADVSLAARLAGISEHLRASPGTVRAADLIEAVAAGRSA